MQITMKDVKPLADKKAIKQFIIVRGMFYVLHVVLEDGIYDVMLNDKSSTKCYANVEPLMRFIFDLEAKTTDEQDVPILIQRRYPGRGRQKVAS